MIKKIKYKNFKGLQDFTLDLNGSSTEIFGDNATGKTSLYDGYLWLIAGKDSLDQADFEIKPIGMEKPEVVVECQFKGFVLKKSMSEKWTKKRGQSQSEFTGHEIKYYIDGVPVKKKEYDDFISDRLCNPEIFKVLSNPLAFNSLPWQRRREILFDISGNIPNIELISDIEEYKELDTILRGNSPDNHKKVIESRRREINKELETIPARLDELRQSMKDAPQYSGDDIIHLLQSDINKLQKSSFNADIQAKEQEKKKLISDFDIELQKLNSLKILETDKLKSEIHKKIDEIKSDEGKLSASIDTFAFVQKGIEKLRENYREESAIEFNQSNICPTCRQEFPPEMYEQFKADFNLAKSQKLEEISTKGKSLKIESDNLDKEIIRLESKQAGLNEIIQKLTNELTQKEVSFNDRIMLLQKNHEINMNRIEKELSELNIGSHDDEKTAKLEKLQKELSEVQAKQAAYKQTESAKARIKEIESKRKHLVSELDKIEYELDLIERFIRFKCDILTDKINAHFKLCGWKLFDIQINGGISDCCECMVDSVPYNSVNGAGRIQAGLDCISVLQNHYDKRLPVWIDNRESIVRLIEMDCQLISLVVSEKDDMLRIEQKQSEKITMIPASSSHYLEGFTEVMEEINSNFVPDFTARNDRG